MVKELLQLILMALLEILQLVTKNNMNNLNRKEAQLILEKNITLDILDLAKKGHQIISLVGKNITVV